MENRAKTDIEKRMENPAFRNLYRQHYAVSKIEVQILRILEEKNWSFSKLASKMNTSKSNVSRDLTAGGINSATVSRLSRMAGVFGLVFLPLFVTKQVADSILRGLSRPHNMSPYWLDVVEKAETRFEIIKIQATVASGQETPDQEKAKVDYSGLPNQIVPKMVCYG